MGKVKKKGCTYTLPVAWSQGRHFISYDWGVTQLTKKEKKVVRRTFRLVREVADYKKGLVVQEACDDGDQEYKSINHDDFVKFDDHGKYFEDNEVGYSRKAVEDNPSYFAEVFEAVSRYLTKEELAEWNSYQAKSGGKPVTATDLLSHAERLRRAKISKAAKRRWAAKRASQEANFQIPTVQAAGKWSSYTKAKRSRAAKLSWARRRANRG